MIIIRLRGGLGNQMFQYAFATALAKRLNTDVKIDLTSLLRNKDTKGITARNYQLHIFNVDSKFILSPKTISFLSRYKLNFAIQLLKVVRLFGVKKIKEKQFNYDKNILENTMPNALYNGYWQSEKYFKDAENEVRTQFTFKNPLSKDAKLFLNSIKSTNSVCMHVRRGDYVTIDGFNLSDIGYFENAANAIANKEENIHFFIFSDEPEWCMKHIKLKHKFTVVDYKTEAPRYKEDLELMSNCNHFVMSASSFSWWAVWLRNNKSGVVIAPKDWFINDDKDVSDLVNPNWIRL